MMDISNYQIEKLQDLVVEMDKTLYGLSPGFEMPSVFAQLSMIGDEIDLLHDLVIELGQTIYPLTSSSFLKGVVNSVLDTMSVDTALDDLKTYNKQRSQKRKEQTERIPCIALTMNLNRLVS